MQDLESGAARDLLEDRQQLGRRDDRSARRQVKDHAFQVEVDRFLSVGFEDVVLHPPAPALQRQPGQRKVDGDGFPDPHFTQELGLQARIGGRNAKLGEADRRKAAFGKEPVAQVGRRVDIGRIVDMVVRIQVRPADLIGLGIFAHAATLFKKCRMYSRPTFSTLPA